MDYRLRLDYQYFYYLEIKSVTRATLTDYQSVSVARDNIICHTFATNTIIVARSTIREGVLKIREGKIKICEGEMEFCLARIRDK